MFIKTTLSLFLLLLSTHFSTSNTVELTDEEYHQLPALFEVQNYERCLSQRENVFCAGTFELTSPEPSCVYEILKKFSSNKQYFNHTRIHRAVCLGPKHDCLVKDDLTLSFEECIDRSMFEDHGLRAHLIRFDFCRRPDEKPKIDGLDIIFYVYLAIVVILNIAGTVYDCLLKEVNAKGNRWLMAFSLADNWKRLTSRSEGQDPRFQNLSCLNGIKTLSFYISLQAHIGIVMIMSFPTNPRFFEQFIQTAAGKYVSYHSNILIQSFVFVANFLTAYKILVSSEKYAMKLSLLPKLIIDRIVRIQPMHLTCIGIATAIISHLNDGPLWYKYVGSEVTRCRDLWWHHVFFAHNTLSWADCEPQSWYLALDVQLYIISCVIMLWILGRGLDPVYVLKRLLAASLLLLLAIVYFYQLLPQSLIVNLENMLHTFAEESSFVYLYQSVWGNLPVAILGLLIASIYYQLERKKVDLSKNKNFEVMFQLSLPLLFLWTILMYWFMYMKVESRLAVSLYATYEKIGFAAILSIVVIGCFYKIKGPATTILCWPGWMVLSRLSLGALMVHVMVNANITFSRVYSTASFTQMAADTIAVIVISYLLALLLALMVEYPAVQLYKGFINSDETRNITSVKSKKK